MSQERIEAGRYWAVVNNQLDIVKVRYQAVVRSERTGRLISPTSVEQLVQRAEDLDSISNMASALANLDNGMFREELSVVDPVESLDFEYEMTTVHDVEGEANILSFEKVA